MKQNIIMDISDLKKIGLTKGEIQIYSALLELGETTRTELAKKSGISPSKIYDVANRLIEKGIISSIKKMGVTHFSAASPERLKDYLEQKEKEIGREKTLVDHMLPELMAKYQKTEQKTDIEVFYGWKGMRTVYTDLANELHERDENFIIGGSIGRDSTRTDSFFSEYYRKVEKQGYSIKIIFNENVRGNKKRTGYLSKSKKHKIRFLRQETFTEINLYKDTVLFVMLIDKPIILRIKSKQAADSFRNFFTLLWKTASR